MIRKFTLAIIALSAATQAATAQTLTAASGIKTLVAHHERHDAQCHFFTVTIRVTSPPAHGKLAVQCEQVPVDGQCRAGAGVRIYYQSTRGFVGEDSFSYLRISNDGSDRFNGEVSRTISVR
jgi:hypothetical protein